MPYGGHPVTIDGKMGDGIVDPRHDVLAVLVPPGSPGGPLEVVAVSGRTPEVGLEDEVPVGSEELVLEIEAVAGCGVGTAVTMDDHRVGPLVRIVPVGIEDPPLDGRSVVARVEEPFGPAQGDLPAKIGVDIREAAFIGAVQIRRHRYPVESRRAPACRPSSRSRRRSGCRRGSAPHE